MPDALFRLTVFLVLVAVLGAAIGFAGHKLKGGRPASAFGIWAIAPVLTATLMSWRVKAAQRALGVVDSTIDRYPIWTLLLFLWATAYGASLIGVWRPRATAASSSQVLRSGALAAVGGLLVFLLGVFTLDIVGLLRF